MIGELRGQAPLQHRLDQFGKEAALAGELHPAGISAVDQLIQPRVVSQLLT